MNKRAARNRMGRTVYVANINYEATNQDLLEFFRGYGDAVSAQVITDRETGDSRGYGFVDMKSDKDAETALGADGTEMMGRKLKVSLARARGAREGGS